jgi:DNA-binding beta-propeller fold protein YncE
MAMDSVALPLPIYPVLGRVSAVTADDRGNLYILNRAADGDPVVVLDPDGRLLRSWGKGLFTMPHGIRIDPAGNVWTVDANTSKIYKFNAAGGLLLQVQLERPREDIEFCGATDVAFLPDGHVLVSDGYCNGRVVELNPDGERVREWGSRGREPGQFRVAHSIALGPDQVVYVADRENGRLQRFDRLGRLLGVWDYVSQLYSVAFSREGALYISLRLTEEPRNYIVRIDPATGEMLARTSLNCLGHELAVSPGGALLPGLLCPDSTGHVLLYRRRD